MANGSSPLLVPLLKCEILQDLSFPYDMINLLHIYNTFLFNYFESTYPLLTVIKSFTNSTKVADAYDFKNLKVRYLWLGPNNDLATTLRVSTLSKFSGFSMICYLSLAFVNSVIPGLTRYLVGNTWEKGLWLITVLLIRANNLLEASWNYAICTIEAVWDERARLTIHGEICSVITTCCNLRAKLFHQVICSLWVPINLFDFHILSFLHMCLVSFSTDYTGANELVVGGYLRLW